jgi:hypothetical protein
VTNSEGLRRLAAGDNVRAAFANTLKWQQVAEALGVDQVAGGSSGQPAAPKQSPPTNRAQRRAERKRRGGFKKGRRT